MNMNYESSFFGKVSSTWYRSYQVCYLVATISFKGTEQDGNNNYHLDVKLDQESLDGEQPIQLYSCGL